MNVSEELFDYDIHKNESNILFHIMSLQSHYRYVRDDLLKMAKYILINKTKDFINYQNMDGQTVLFITTHREFAQLFLDNGIDPNIQDKFGNTAIMYNMDKIDFAIFLAENGASVTIKNDRGYCALDDDEFKIAYNNSKIKSKSANKK